MPGRQAILFGLNYETTLPSAETEVECDPSYKLYTIEKPLEFEGLKALKGSINDVNNMKGMLSEWKFDDIRTFTDDVCPNAKCPHAHLVTNQTTASGIIEEMNALAARSVDEDLEVAWIHFSGNGASKYDESYDERDWYDECIVPSDFRTAGYVSDDAIRNVLQKFNPNTKVVCVFDCSHSGTIGDLKYRFLESGDSVHREHNQAACEAKVVFISGCSDTQTAVEVPPAEQLKIELDLDTETCQVKKCKNDKKDNTSKGPREEKNESDNTFNGAMTSSLLNAVKALGNVPETIRIHELVQTIRTTLKEKVYNAQHPELTCSYFIEEEETLF